MDKWAGKLVDKGSGKFERFKDRDAGEVLFVDKENES